MQQIHPDDLPGALAVFREKVATANRFSGEYRVRHKQGHWIHVWDQALLIRDERGEAIKMIGCSVDVTELRRVEEQLRELNDRLEHRVSARTRQLRERNRELEEMTRELTHAEQRERERLSRLLHDGVQQLLVAAKMQVGMLEAAAAPDQAELLGGVIEILGESIEATRTLSYELSPPRLQEGTLPETLQWLVSWWRENHRHKVDLSVAPDFPRLRTEVKILAFAVVRELMLNCVKHSGVTESRLVLGRLSSGDAVIEVADRGRGFDPAALEHSPPETGMGFSSIRQRLAAFGGQMEIESRPGQGACFTLTLPCEKPA
jgi:signal transduction histidine kinase